MVRGLVYRAQGQSFTIPGLGYRVHNFDKVEGLGFRV
jgi:hypothetical protein